MIASMPSRTMGVSSATRRPTSASDNILLAGDEEWERSQARLDRLLHDLVEQGRLAGIVVVQQLLLDLGALGDSVDAGASEVWRGKLVPPTRPVRSAPSPPPRGQPHDLPRYVEAPGMHLRPSYLLHPAFRSASSESSRLPSDDGPILALTKWLVLSRRS